MDNPRKGEIWYRIYDSTPVRVMCDPVERYVMVRIKGCVPFLVHESDWANRFLRVGNATDEEAAK